MYDKVALTGLVTVLSAVFPEQLVPGMPSPWKEEPVLLRNTTGKERKKVKRVEGKT